MSGKRNRLVGLISLALACSGSLATAQTGTLDQDSPVPSGSAGASFNVDSTTLTWQQQVRCGLAGQLEGFSLYLTGPVGASCDVKLRLGDGWSSNPVVFSTTYAKTTAGTENPFFDVTSSGILLSVGNTFVIELLGHGNGMWLLGSYIDPAVGPPLYPEYLYLNGSSTCYSNCGWRHGFKTWMVSGSVGTAYCFGDGSGTLCPCANNNDGSVPESGCANGAFASGAHLSGSGQASVGNDTLVLATSGLDPNNSGLYFQANNDLSPGIIWGDGLQCAGGQLKRLGVRFSDATGYSDTSAWTTPISVRAGNVTAGVTKYYQCWYRDTSGNQPCGAGVNDFNASNGYAVTWTP